jgi:hypothetical protein
MYRKVQENLWKEKLRKVHANERFRVYGLKHRSIDCFLNSMYRGKEKPILAYGSANINPTGKGEVTVPVKYIKRACDQKFEVFPVDEFRTSKVCYKCGELLDEVKFEGEKFPVRGLRWCKTKTCSCELMDRDFNAAKNILNRYLNIGSFENMSRDSPSHKKRVKVKLLKV